MDDQERRMLRVKAQLYRLFALIFMGVGFVIFTTIYFERIEGRVLDALKEPATLIIVLLPFVPAGVLSWMAGQASKKSKKPTPAAPDENEDSGDA